MDAIIRLREDGQWVATFAGIPMTGHANSGAVVNWILNHKNDFAPPLRRIVVEVDPRG